MDIQKDRRRGNLWIINTDGTNRALTSGDTNDLLPRWSPDGKRLLYLQAVDGAPGGPQLMCRWMDTNETGRLAKLPAAPLGIADMS